jgi:hypothetical protein
MDLRGIDPKLIESIREAIGEADYEEWMEKPIPTLGGRTPLQVLNSPGGIEEIKSLLIMINTRKNW